MPRVYTPVTSDDVAELLARVQFYPASAFGLTPRLRQVFEQEDDEGLEHLATQFAAAACGGDPIAVAVFEATNTAGTASDMGTESVPGSMTVEGALQHRDLVCFLVADAGARMSEEADLELSWYDAGELPTVLELLRAHGAPASS